MSLQQGPIDLLTTSVADAKTTLLVLRAQCLEQAQHHRQVIADFLTHVKLDEIRQIPKRYPKNQLDESLVESANCYSLNVNSNFKIILHGIEALEHYFSHANQLQLDQIFTYSSRPLKLLAKTKLQLEKTLSDFIRDRHRNEKLLVKDEDTEDLLLELAPQDSASIQEKRDKEGLENAINQFDADNKKILTEPERFVIEYYETVLKATAIFDNLTKLKKALGSLQEHLDKLIPIEEVTTPSLSSKKWEASFTNTDLFNGSDLTTLLKSKLSLHEQDIDIAADLGTDWDASSLPGSKRSSLTQAADPSVVQTALLLQFQHQTTLPSVRAEEEVAEEEDVVLNAKVHLEPSTTNRPDL